MKKFLLLSVFIMLSISLFAVNITLLSMTGTVQIKENENSQWRTPIVGQKLKAGFIIYTGFNSSAIVRAENAKIEVKPLTEMNISSLVTSNKSINTKVNLKYGKISADVTSSKDIKTHFSVRSANSTASVRGTKFSFGDDTLVVERGTVYLLSNSGFSTLVQQNEKAIASKLNLLSTPIKEKIKNTFVNTLPTGVSTAELDQFQKFIIGKVTGTGTITITVNVIGLQ